MVHARFGWVSVTTQDMRTLKPAIVLPPPRRAHRQPGPLGPLEELVATSQPVSIPEVAMVTPPTFSYSFSSKTTAEIHTSRQARPRPPTPHAARSGSGWELTLCLPALLFRGVRGVRAGKGGVWA